MERVPGVDKGINVKKINEFWTPIFYREGNLLVFISLAFLAESEETAQDIGGFIAENVLLFYGAEYTGEVLHVDRGQWYVPGRLAGHPVAILSGPAFTKATAVKAA